jgi:hypothetical protein
VFDKPLVSDQRDVELQTVFMALVLSGIVWHVLDTSLSKELCGQKSLALVRSSINSVAQINDGFESQRSQEIAAVVGRAHARGR